MENINKLLSVRLHARLSEMLYGKLIVGGLSVRICGKLHTRIHLRLLDRLDDRLYARLFDTLKH